MRKYINLRATIALGLIFVFLINTLGPIPLAQAQEFYLPAPGQMVALSPAFNPAVLKGIKLDPKNPFRFHFFVDRGDSSLSQAELKSESAKLIKYFLASLTIPEKDLWVNLSPYEKGRIVPLEFGQTEMGRDLLAQDYLLKQITASLIYPESQLGKEFWTKVYAQAQAKYGTTNISINTFNKVWIMPEKAVVYEKGGIAFVLENHLKVMLEQDYLSLAKHEGIQSGPVPVKDTNQLGSQIVREIVIPALTKEVNEGKNFSQLRQVFYSLILATWYKNKIKESILNKIYSDKSKINGVNVSARDRDIIYQEYLKAFKKGVYNYIKDIETPDGVSVPRKYFSGGVEAYQMSIQYKSQAQVTNRDFAQLGELTDVSGDMGLIPKPSADKAMTGEEASKEQLLKDVPAYTRIPLKFIENDVRAHRLLNNLSASRVKIFGAYLALILYLVNNDIKSNLHVAATINSLVWFLQKSRSSYLRVKRETELFDMMHSVAKIVEAYLSEKSNVESNGKSKKENEFFQRLRFLLTAKDIAPRAFAIAANGDLIVYWKEPYVQRILAPFIYPIPYWIAPLENWRKKTVTVKKFSWGRGRILKPVVVPGQAFISLSQTLLLFSKENTMSTTDGAMTGEIATKEQLPKGIPAYTRIPLKFLKNDTKAYESLISALKWNIIWGALVLFDLVQVNKDINPTHNIIAFRNFSTSYFFKSTSSYLYRKDQSESFNDIHSIARIVEAYLSAKSNEESNGKSKKKKELFQRLRFLLTAREILPRAFAIAANGDLIVYWKEPYIQQKLAPILYPVPYWIAPLEDWRKKTVTVKEFSRNLFRISNPIPARGQAFISQPILAPVSGKVDNGGIDLNPAQMSLQVKKDGEDFKFDFNGTEIDAAQVTGATFTILQMTPVINLPLILGLSTKRGALQSDYE